MADNEIMQSKTLWQRKPGTGKWDMYLERVADGAPDRTQVWISIGIPRGGAVQIDLQPDELIELGLVMVKAGNDLRNMGVTP